MYDAASNDSSARLDQAYLGEIIGRGRDHPAAYGTGLTSFLSGGSEPGELQFLWCQSVEQLE